VALYPLSLHDALPISPPSERWVAWGGFYSDGGWALQGLGAMRSFSSRFVDALPGDPLEVALPRPVTGALWSKVRPTPVAGPALRSEEHTSELQSRENL